MPKNNKNDKSARRSDGRADMMRQMGFQMPTYGESGMVEDDDDGDLEAELRRLQQDTGGAQQSRRSKADQQNLGGMAQNLQAFHNDVNKLLYDIDRPVNDDELSDIDENELLAELNDMTDEFESDRAAQTQAPQPQKASSVSTLSLLEARQSMYTKAIAAAKASGETTKVRRLERQLKTIQDLLTSVRSGARIDESEIPPEVYVASQSESVPQQTPVRAPSPPRALPQAPAAFQPTVPPSRTVIPAAQSRVSIPTVQPTPPIVAARTNANSGIVRPQVPASSDDTGAAIARLKALALQAKHQGDMAKAKEYIIQLKALQTSSEPTTIQRETYDNVAEDDGPPPALPLKAPEPRTIMEALQQRYEELTKRGEEAARNGDNSKARRMERISKQYEEAMDATRKNRPYNYNDLPDLPGFAPIPVQQATPQSAPSSTAPITTAQTRSTPAQSQRPTPPTVPNNAISARKNKQVQLLRLKQEKFHKLALQAKTNGDIETAKKFLVAYKGLEQMIEAAENGRPIDMSQVPKLPEDDGDMIDDDDLTDDLARADRDTIFRRLQDDLLRQIETCKRNQQIYAQMDGINAGRHISEYKALEQRCTNDLEKIRHSFQRGANPPLFHYERKQTAVIQTNNDLGDNDLEVTVLRGINLPVPSGQSSSSLETYVVIEFPYPTEAPQTARTRHATGSVNAEYPEGSQKFFIKRNDAKFRRQMNRKELKFGVFYKAGFLRGERPLGIASLKLAALEQACTIHESVDLFESEHRKKIDGKLEIKLRIKEALTQTKVSDILPQRWLIIDSFEEVSSKSKHSSSSSSSHHSNPAELTDRQRRRLHPRHEPEPEPQAPPSRPSASRPPQSVQVLNYEASLIQQQIEQYQDRLNPDQIHQLKAKRRQIEQQLSQVTEYLRTGGKQAVQEHIRGLEMLQDQYDQEAREYQQRRDKKRADIALTKKTLALREIETLIKPTSSSVTSSTRF